MNRRYNLSGRKLVTYMTVSKILSASKISWICLTIFLASFLSIVCSPKPATALSDTPNQNTWVTNGQVHAIIDDGATTYIGGNFSYVGPPTGSGVPFDIVTGSSGAIYPKVDGYVSTVVSDGIGGWYIGGCFRKVGGKTRNNIAHILTDGSVDSVWNPNAIVISDGSVAYASVNALAISGGTVYVGGRFTSIGGQQRNNIAALDATTGNATSWNPSALSGYGSSTYVSTLAVKDGVVYAGGNFSNIGGQRRNYIAALDATTGSATSWNPDINSIGGTAVNAIAVDGGTVYVGGSFTNVDAQPRNNLAALDVSTGSITSWAPDATGSNYYSRVNTLVVKDGTVYVGGAFTRVGGQSRNNLAALDVSTGNATSWNPDVSGDSSFVSTLAISGGTVYVGGKFTGVGGVPRNNIAALDAATGSATSWNLNVGGFVYALAINGGTIYVGGSFTSVGGVPRNNIAALDTSTGRATSWNPNASTNDGPEYATVTALALSGGTVYTGGWFTSIGGQPRNYIAALDASTGNATSWNPNVSGVDGYAVYVLAVSNAKIYVGGSFKAIGGQPRNSLAALDIATGRATSWNPNVDNSEYTTVNTLAIIGETIYVGGSFTSMGDQPRNSLAALDALTGNVTSWNPDVNDTGYSTVNTLAVNGDTVYVGGNFISIGGQERNNIAAVDASTGNVTSWNPDATVAHDYCEVSSLVVCDGTVYAGGAFTSIGGQPRNNLAALDAATGNATSWNPDVSGDNQALISTLVIKSGTLYIGGNFSTIGGECRPNFARFDSDLPPTYSISGTVSASTTPLSEVTVALSGAATGSAKTGVDGTYAFKDLSSGIYTITPSKTQYSFSPSKRSVNVDGSDLTGQDFIGTYIQPFAADFTASPTSGKAPLAVKYTDKSTGTIKSRLWEFGNGKTSTSQNPSHTYTKPGTYTVKLTVTRADGAKNTKTQTNLISVYAAPKADFSATPTNGKAPLAVKFSDRSTGGATSWSWSFGDGQTSKDKNPSHTYTKSGKYTVTLTIANPAGTSTKTKANYIQVTSSPSAELEGTWTGHEVDHDSTWTLVVSGNHMKITTSGGWYGGTISLNTSRNPKQVDYRVTGGSYSGYFGKTSFGIYKIENQTLTYAANEPGISARPSSFTPGNGTRVFILTKQ